MTQRPKRFRRLLLAGAALATALSAGALVAAAAPGAGPIPRIEALESDAAALGSMLEAIGEAIGAPPDERIRLAQNREEAQINVRLDQLEERMRTLTGQVEALQFQLSQLQGLIERMQQDYEFRFQGLEGGEAGKSEAVPESGGATPTEAVPPATAIEERLPQAPLLPADVIGESLDPLIAQPDNPEAGILGTLPADLFDRPLGATDLTGDELALPSDRVSNADAEAQYNAGVDALQRSDLVFAADQFRQFIALYPRHRLAPDATTLLGEALLRQQDYDEAAQVLVVGYETYPDSPRAPEMLLGLGSALAGAGERETACRTYVEILRRYPGQPASFLERLRQQQRTAQC
ncbi:MAG: tol-pal system protein YbgF [Cucumibacter sp.]